MAEEQVEKVEFFSSQGERLQGEINLFLPTQPFGRVLHQSQGVFVGEQKRGWCWVCVGVCVAIKALVIVPQSLSPGQTPGQ